jgi:hypothetical protein
LFQNECSDNPNRFRSRFRLRFSIEGGETLRSNTIDVPLATSAQVNVRARNGVAFRSLFSAKEGTVCGSEMAGQPQSQPVTGPIGRTRASAANMTPVKASTIARCDMLRGWDGGKPRGA